MLACEHDDDDDEGMRARSFQIKTRQKCQEQEIEIAGEYLLTLERYDGAVFTFSVATTTRMLQFIRDLDPAEVYMLVGTGEDCPLPDLLAYGAPVLH